MTVTVTPFAIAVPGDVLDDLGESLRRTRFTEEPEQTARELSEFFRPLRPGSTDGC